MRPHQHRLLVVGSVVSRRPPRPALVPETPLLRSARLPYKEGRGEPFPRVKDQEGQSLSQARLPNTEDRREGHQRGTRRRRLTVERRLRRLAAVGGRAAVGGGARRVPAKFGTTALQALVAALRGRQKGAGCSSGGRLQALEAARREEQERPWPSV